MPYIIPRLLGKFMLCRNPKRERGSFLTDVSGYHKRCNNLRRSVKFPITRWVTNKFTVSAPKATTSISRNFRSLASIGISFE